MLAVMLFSARSSAVLCGPPQHALLAWVTFTPEGEQRLSERAIVAEVEKRHDDDASDGISSEEEGEEKESEEDEHVDG